MNPLRVAAARHEDVRTVWCGARFRMLRGEPMGLMVLEGSKINEGRDATGAVLYCSTTGQALPWIFPDGENAEAFIEANGDIRRLTHAEQEELFTAWLAKVDA